MAINVFIPRVRINKYKVVGTVIVSEIDIFQVLGNLYYILQITISSSLFSADVAYKGKGIVGLFAPRMMATLTVPESLGCFFKNADS